METQAKEQVDESSSLLKQLREAIPDIDSQEDANVFAKALEGAMKLGEAGTKAKADEHQKKAEQLIEEAQKKLRDESQKAAAKKGIVSTVLDDATADATKAPESDDDISWLDSRGHMKSRIVASVSKSPVAGRKMAQDLRFKALGEATSGAGGYLVPPAFLQDMFAETRRQGNALRKYGLISEHPVETNLIYIPIGSGAATTAILAEGATKPSADQSYTQLAVTVYEMGGISKVSVQLMQDSSPTVADLVSRELGSLLGNLEEQKILNGSGTGEPYGIINTTGVNAVTATNLNGYDLIGYIIDGIVAIQTNYFAPPNAIAMAPRRWGFLSKAKDDSHNFLFNNPGVFRAPADWPKGVTSVSTGGEQTLPMLMGLPVAITANMPLTNNTTQDVVIVGDFKEAHWFQRQDTTLDVSDEAGTSFETNQVWFRLEERAGFTAGRYPKAFSVLTGAALAASNI